MSRVKIKVTQKAAMHALAEAVHQIQLAGDGCPKSVANIMNQFEKNSVLSISEVKEGKQRQEGQTEEGQKAYTLTFKEETKISTSLHYL